MARTIHRAKDTNKDQTHGNINYVRRHNTVYVLIMQKARTRSTDKAISLHFPPIRSSCAAWVAGGHARRSSLCRSLVRQDEYVQKNPLQFIIYQFLWLYLCHLIELSLSNTMELWYVQNESRDHVCTYVRTSPVVSVDHRSDRTGHVR